MLSSARFGMAAGLITMAVTSPGVNERRDEPVPGFEYRLPGAAVKTTCSKPGRLDRGGAESAVVDHGGDTGLGQDLAQLPGVEALAAGQLDAYGAVGVAVDREGGQVDVHGPEPSRTDGATRLPGRLTLVSMTGKAIASPAAARPIPARPERRRRARPRATMASSGGGCVTGSLDSPSRSAPSTSSSFT